MKDFDVSTTLESGGSYLFSGNKLITLSDTKRTRERKYLTIHEGAEYLDTAFLLRGLKDVTLDFGGAVITLRGRIQPFIIDECENVTVKNVVIEYERSLFTELDVVKNTGDELYLRKRDKFPCKEENGYFIPYGADFEDRELYKKGCMFIQGFSRESGEGKGLDVIYLGEEIIPEPSPPADNIKHVRLRSEGEYIVFSGRFPSQWDESTTIVLEHENRFKSSAAVYHSENIRFENYRILNGCGMGIFALGTRNIYLSGLKLFRDHLSHGIVTNSADGIHFVACRGEIRLQDCTFEGMIDDALNIHANYYQCVKADGGLLFAKRSSLSHCLNAYSEVFRKGDTIAVYNGKTLEEKGRCTLTEVNITGRWELTMKTDGLPDDVNEGDLTENLSTNPEIYISRCRFGKANTHLRFQSRGKTVIESCEFSLPVLLTGDMNYWFEASPVNDFTLRNCKFTGERGKIRIIPEFTPTEKAPFYHKNIKILNNTFEEASPLEYSGAENVVFEGNITG